jgi:hypothetical protein
MILYRDAGDIYNIDGYYRPPGWTSTNRHPLTVDRCTVDSCVSMWSLHILKHRDHYAKVGLARGVTFGIARGQRGRGRRVGRSCSPSVVAVVVLVLGLVIDLYLAERISGDMSIGRQWVLTLFAGLLSSVD